MARGVWLEPGILDLMVPASEVGVRSVDIYHMVTLYKYSKFEIYMQRNKGDRGISNIGVLGGKDGATPQGVVPGGHFVAKYVLEGSGPKVPWLLRSHGPFIW